MANIIYHYIVFMDEHPEITNRMLTQFFDSFANIEEGDFDMRHWIGKVGACVVGVDKNDPERTRISYFIKADKQGDLPPWRNARGEAVKPDEFAGDFDEVQDDDNPFF